MSAAIANTPSSATILPFAEHSKATRDTRPLRLITCGSVDDGKSTLIGRLLWDTKAVKEDQAATLHRDSGKQNDLGLPDFALLLDGLQAEREQGITIDVAYRYFATDRRAFIVADTPGHEQYTRNMATGASTADVAVILVDARHGLLVSLLGIHRVALAINKMDLVGWSQDKFEAILSGFQAFAAPLNFSEVRAIPLSAKNGDNVVLPGTAATWYDGVPLLRYLEEVPVKSEERAAAFRMPVQWVNRPNSDFRGFSGLIASGSVAPGDAVTVAPSGKTSTVARIFTADGDLERASEGQSVTLVLADEVDASRGAVIATSGAPLTLTDSLDVRLFWAAESDLVPGASLWAKVGTQTVNAVVKAVHRRIDPETGQAGPADKLAVNDIGDVTLTLDRQIAVDPYVENRDTGSLILIDRETTDTAALGLVQTVAASGNAAAPAPTASETASQEPARSGGLLAGIKRLFGG